MANSKHNPTIGFSFKERRDYYVKLSVDKYGDTFDYSNILELPLKSHPVLIGCPIHGVIKTTFYKHLMGKKGCYQCGQDMAHNSKRYTHEVFISKLDELYPDRQWVVLSKYVHNKVGIYVQDKYGVCLIKPNSMLTRSTPNIKTAVDKTEYTINKFIEVHRGKYDYSKFKYLGVRSKSIIICKEHGEFKQDANMHLFARGCPKCGEEVVKQALLSSTPEFIKSARRTHGDTYGYEKSNYITARTLIEIKCPTHGYFWQDPNSHLCGSGCIKCSNSGPSKGEQAMYDFVSSFTDVQQSNRKVLDGKELDIYVKNKNLAIEFDGLYYHSDKFRKSSYHLDKTSQCESKGIQLIHVFEDEWKYKQNIVKSRLKNILGITDKRIFARKCVVKEISTKDKSEFLDTNHIQGKVGSKVNLGLYFEGELVSLMTFGKLRKNLGQTHRDGHWELLRFCNKLDITVVGGAGKLLKHFENNFEVIELISYADRRWSQGNLYTKLNFELASTSSPNYFYTKGKGALGREARFKYRKDILVSQGFDKDKTEKEIMKERGYFRIYDCGTLKYVKKYS